MKASEKKRKITIIMGQQGAGKSTLLKELLRKDGSKRRIVVDALGEFEDGVVVSTPSELAKAVSKARFNVIIRFDPRKGFKPIDGFIWGCKAATAAKRCSLVVDEVDMYSDAWDAPDEFSWLVQYGRHHAVTMYCIARRPKDLWKSLRANANEIYMLRMIDPDDQKYLAAFIGKGPAAKLKDLKTLHYVCYHGDGRITSGRTSF